MRHIVLTTIAFLSLLVPAAFGEDSAQLFRAKIQPLLTKYCSNCHGGDAPVGDVSFDRFKTADDIVDEFQVLEKAAQHLTSKTMPPADEKQPTSDERQRIVGWVEEYVAAVEVRPGDLKPRRLSVAEYRNTLRAVFGFDLRVAIIEAEQTLAERSLVIKLMPVDPPGRSGFKNDTHRNPLTTVAWDQYSYLADAAIDQLFLPARRDALNALLTAAMLLDDAEPVSPLSDDQTHLTVKQAQRLILVFLQRTRRRTIDGAQAEQIFERLDGLSGKSLARAVRLELKSLLMAPTFLYRGLLAQVSEESPLSQRRRSETPGFPSQAQSNPGHPSKDTAKFDATNSAKRGTAHRGNVDAFELAERLSYFLWASMPDDRLLQRAQSGALEQSIEDEIDRMLESPRARSLAEVFATEWFTINEIEHVSDNPPVMLALKSQPLDFAHYLFTNNRPLLELIDSNTAFINPHTRGLYGADAKQMTRYRKQKGIEVEAVPNQQIALNTTEERGGLLTMPGILAMNKGPIQRGTWILERILGETLPEPPPDVGQVQPNRSGEKLSFRKRFEQHRNNATCAVCHDKIDPLGFALETYDRRGHFIKSKAWRPNKKDVKRGVVTPDPDAFIDTSGQLPSGEKFFDINELKQILTTSQRRSVLRNIVERTMSYALCRRLMVYDRPVIESITDDMDKTNGTWRDLFVAIANSVPFREAVFEK